VAAARRRLRERSSWEGNAARLVSAHTLCRCMSRARRGLAARMLLVQSEHVVAGEAGYRYRWAIAAIWAAISAGCLSGSLCEPSIQVTGISGCSAASLSPD
jgi:hypothetical protein